MRIHRSGWTKENAICHEIHFKQNEDGGGRSVPAEADDPEAEVLRWYFRPMMGRDLQLMKGDDDIARMKELVLATTLAVEPLVDEDGNQVQFGPEIFDEFEIWILNDVGTAIGGQNATPVTEGE